MSPKPRNDGDILARSALDTGSAVASIVASFGQHAQLACSDRSYRRDAHKLLYDLPRTSTPFGTLCEESTLRGPKADLSIYHVNPPAFLFQAALENIEFCKFLTFCQSKSPNNILRLGLYLDEVMPGNQMRPDRGRACQNVYFTIIDFPAWFIARHCGWMPFSFIRIEDQKTSGLSDSAIMVFALSRFRVEGVSNCDFILIVHGNRLCFKVELELADWPQHKKTFNLKGHNGSVCCYWCANCLGRCEYFVSDHLVHFLSTEYEKLVKHTHETFMHQVAKVQHAALHGSLAELKALEHATGLKYELGGLMFTPEAAARLRMPHAAYVDWMHTIASSGGFGQYHLNQMAHKWG